jgi:hypothetical protein
MAKSVINNLTSSIAFAFSELQAMDYYTEHQLTEKIPITARLTA